MEENMDKLNWPTAFVIVAIIFAGAFVYNKPTDAGLGSDAGMILKGPWDRTIHFPVLIPHVVHSKPISINLLVPQSDPNLDKVSFWAFPAPGWKLFQKIRPWILNK
mgnify:CR=1 FL=1